MVLGPVVGLHLGLQVLGILGQDGHSVNVGMRGYKQRETVPSGGEPEVPGVEVLQHPLYEVRPPVRHQVVPGQHVPGGGLSVSSSSLQTTSAGAPAVPGTVTVQGVCQLLRRSHSLLPLLQLETLLC